MHLVKRTISREVVEETGSSLRLTPQRPHAELLGSLDLSEERSNSVANQDEDMVRASWRHGELHEQGSRTGRCGWITSFLRSHLIPS